MEARIAVVQLAVPSMPRHGAKQKDVRAGAVVGKPAGQSRDGATLRVGDLNSHHADRPVQLAYAALFVAGAAGIVHALSVLAEFLRR